MKKILYLFLFVVFQVALVVLIVDKFSENTSPDDSSASVKSTAVYDLKADPNFSESQLSADTKLWYTRMWTLINTRRAQMNPKVALGMTKGDQYLIARVIGPYMYSLSDVLRVTNDPKIIAEMDYVMETIRTKLVDQNGDGYKFWLELNTPSDTTYYGKEDQIMDNELCASFIAQITYILRLNQNLNPKYKEHADFWQQFLLHDFEAKWKSKNNGTMPYKTLAHPYANMMLYYYFTYKLTGEQWRYDQFKKRSDILHSGTKVVSVNGANAYVWDHRVPGGTAIGCQPTEYAHLTYFSFISLYWEKAYRYATNDYMEPYMVTVRELVLKNGITNPAGDICDGVTVPGL